MAQEKTLTRYLDPVEIPGDVLVRLINRDINGLGLFAYRQGQVKPIPFQIDERDELGNFALPSGPQGSLKGADGILNIQDIMVFMAADLGDRAPREELIRGEGYCEDLRVEIEVTDPVNGGKGWVYLLAFDGVPPSAPETKVDVSIKEGFCISSPYYRLPGLQLKSGKETLNTNRPGGLSILRAAGGDGENFVDSARAAAQSYFLGFIPLIVTEKKAYGGVLKYKAGPVRVLVNGNMSPPLPFPLNHMAEKLPSAVIDSFFYDRMSIFPIRTKGRPFYANLIADASVKVGLNLNQHAYGMKFANAANPEEVAVDGKMNGAEINWNSSHDQWRYYTGPQGTLVIRSLYDERLTRYIKLNTEYLDDAQTAGAIGYCFDKSYGRELIKRWFISYFHIYIPNNLYQQDAAGKKSALQEICSVRDQPLRIKVGEEELVNEATSALPLSPQ